MNDSELEQFKQSVSIIGYAESVGYSPDRAKSSRTVKVYRREMDKVIVWTGLDGHEVYRNERDHTDHGSIVDFVMRDEGCNLGRARMTLRKYLGTSRPSSPPCPSVKPSAAANQGQGDGFRKKTLAVWKAARWEPEPAYLRGRGLLAATLGDPRFVDTFRVDGKGNVIFPHFDRQGMCGYELRREGFKSFGSGTHKALWFSQNIRTASSIVLCESSIDCMSHYQIHGVDDSAYASISGTPSALQRDLLTGLLLKAADRGVKVYAAFDNDAAGDGYHESLQLLSPQPLERLRPIGNDWNDDLKNSSRYSMWHVTNDEAHRQAATIRQDSFQDDVWKDDCISAFHRLKSQIDHIQTADILREMGIKIEQHSKAAEIRINQIMRSGGYEYKQAKRNYVNKKAWITLEKVKVSSTENVTGYQNDGKTSTKTSGYPGYPEVSSTLESFKGKEATADDGGLGGDLGGFAGKEYETEDTRGYPGYPADSKGKTTGYPTGYPDVPEDTFSPVESDPAAADDDDVEYF